jgi:probable HAF family extracellular repeat protein
MEFHLWRRLSNFKNRNSHEEDKFMNSIVKFLCQSCTTASLVLLPSIAAAADAQYRVQDLGAISADSVFPAGVNAAGDVAGRTEKRHGGNTRAFLSSRRSGVQKINPFVRGGFNAIYGMNDFAHVVGTSETENGVRGFVVGADGKISDVGALEAGASSEAFGINNAGEIVGYSTLGDQLRSIFVDSHRGLHDVGTLPGDFASQGFGINDAGQVVGSSSGPNGTRAFLWSASTGMQPLPTPPGYADGLAFRISNQGVIVGHANTPWGTRAIMWGASGTIDIGTLPGGTFSDATGVNNAGTVVGTSGGVLGNRAFIWTKEKGIQDLNSLLVGDSGVVLTGAAGINDSGVIAAYGSRIHNIDPEQITDEDHGAPLHLFVLVPLQR